MRTTLTLDKDLGLAPISSASRASSV